MKSLKFYLTKAKKEKWAIGQFNFSTLEQMRAAIRAAEKTKSPIILGTSEKEAAFFGIKEAYALKEIISSNCAVPVFLNLDHGKDLNMVKMATDVGYDAVHYDGSRFSFKENLEKTKEAVFYAKKRGVLVEGEIEPIADIPGEKKKNLSLHLIKEFEEKTSVDLLAIAIGSVHGIHKRMPGLDLGRLLEIKRETKAFLVLHGGSGIESRELKKAVKNGIVKVNINTELRKKWKESLLKELSSKEIKPYNILKKVEKEIEKKVVEKIKALHSDKKI